MVKVPFVRIDRYCPDEATVGTMNPTVKSSPVQSIQRSSSPFHATVLPSPSKLLHRNTPEDMNGGDRP